jgi:Domain of unknown function (DUF5666)
MNPGLLRRLLLGAVTGVILVSCGGGSTNLASNSGGIGGTGVVYGPITNFGSIFVNDLEIDIATAGITTDGTTVDESALKLGMVVKVDGTFDATNLTGTATAVTYKDNVEGPITSIDVANNQFVVLGQTVITSSSTNFVDSVSNAVPFGLSDLAVGNVIEVSGLVDSAGNIQATHVEKKSENFVNNSGAVIEVKGTIQNLDTVGETFEINTLQVSYASANLSGLPGNVPADGQYVEVKGMSFGLSGELIATDIELEDEGIGSEAGHDGDYVELKGFVTSLLPLNQFLLDNQTVSISSATRYEGGTANDIQVGARLEVEGTIASGILNAQKISIEGSDNEDSGDGS